MSTYYIETFKFHLCMCAFGVASKNRCNFCIEIYRLDTDPVEHLHTLPKLGSWNWRLFFFSGLHFSPKKLVCSTAVFRHHQLRGSTSSCLAVLPSSFTCLVRATTPPFDARRLAMVVLCLFGVVFLEKRWARVNKLFISGMRQNSCGISTASWSTNWFHSSFVDV